MNRLVLPPDETLQSVLCIKTTNKYLVHVLVVLLHVRFSVVGPIPFLLAAFFFPGHPYIESTTVLPDYVGSTVIPDMNAWSLWEMPLLPEDLCSISDRVLLT